MRSSPLLLLVSSGISTLPSAPSANLSSPPLNLPRSTTRPIPLHPNLRQPRQRRRHRHRPSRQLHPDLPRENFHIFDNGVEQPITDFANVISPAEVLLLVEAGPAVYFLASTHVKPPTLSSTASPPATASPSQNTTPPPNSCSTSPPTKPPPTPLSPTSATTSASAASISPRASTPS